MLKICLIFLVTTGFSDNQRNRKCEVNRFRIHGRCIGICRCQKASYCRESDGSCGGNMCMQGWSGFDCQQRTWHTPGIFRQRVKKQENTPPVSKEIKNPVESLVVTRPSTTTARTSRSITSKLTTNQPRTTRTGSRTCPDYKYGELCQNTCNCHKNEMCDQEGRCPNGCNLRYYGKSCQNTCQNGRYLHKLLCVGLCRCKQKNMCRVTDGTCALGGCEDGRQGANCQLCPVGRFGIECDKKCYCKNDESCDSSGTCPYGCKDRYFGDTCSNACAQGSYLIRGQCIGKCQCRNNSECLVTDGSCGVQGCKTGFAGSDCQECASGRFGRRCHKECHCDSNDVCNRNGICPGSCHPRYYGHYCQSTCNFGKYLTTNVCHGTCRCQDNSKCRVLNGSCGDGKCNSYFLEPHCQVCQHGKYGENCDLTCHCKDNNPCTRAGLCPNNECHHRFYGKKCEKSCAPATYLTGSYCNGTCYCANNNECHVSNGKCGPSGCMYKRTGAACQDCEGSMYGKNCDRQCRCSHVKECINNNGVCKSPCPSGYSGSRCDQPTIEHKTYHVPPKANVGMIVGIIAGVTALVIILVILLVIWRYKRQKAVANEDESYTYTDEDSVHCQYPQSRYDVSKAQPSTVTAGFPSQYEYADSALTPHDRRIQNRVNALRCQYGINQHPAPLYTTRSRGHIHTSRTKPAALVKPQINFTGTRGMHMKPGYVSTYSAAPTGTEITNPYPKCQLCPNPHCPHRPQLFSQNRHNDVSRHFAISHRLAEMTDHYPCHLNHVPCEKPLSVLVQETTQALREPDTADLHDLRDYHWNFSNPRRSAFEPQITGRSPQYSTRVSYGSPTTHRRSANYVAPPSGHFLDRFRPFNQTHF